MIPAQRYYECWKHGVQVGDHCPSCRVTVFIPPSGPALAAVKAKTAEGAVARAAKALAEIAQPVEPVEEYALDQSYWDTHCDSKCGCRSLKEALAHHPELRAKGGSP
jgi:hypothetical protein